MSLVSFTHDQTEVVGGWDPHDKEFVLYVFDLRPGAASSMLWSNLCDHDPIDKHSTERLQARLSRFLRIPAPEGFWERVERQEPERIRYEFVNNTWYRGLYKDLTFQVPMFGEPLDSAEPVHSDRDSDIDIVREPEPDDEREQEVTGVRASLIRLVG